MTSLPFPVSIPSTHSHSHSHSTSTSDSPRLQTRALRGSISFIASRAKFLTQRARTTNLAVSLLALVCFTSLYYNARHTLGNFVSTSDIAYSSSISSRVVVRVYLQFSQSDSSFIPPIPLSLSSTLTPAHQELDHMVMIPGHAIWQGCDASHSTQDKDWILQDFQKDGHHVTTYLKHLTKGYASKAVFSLWSHPDEVSRFFWGYSAEIAVKDPKALLIFSGFVSSSSS